MTVLLDANVLIALTVTDHVHHDLVETWFAGRSEPFATCPVTEGALVRLLLRSGGTTRDAVDVLRGVGAADWHTFWPDELGYEAVDLRGVVGHRQVTDAYLAALARSRGFVRRGGVLGEPLLPAVDRVPHTVVPHPRPATPSTPRPASACRRTTAWTGFRCG